MVKFEPDVIEAYAEHLYAMAARVVLSQTLLAGLLGVVIGGGGGLAIEGQSGPGIITFAFGASLAVLGGVMGYAAGQQKAAQLRLAAQTALCQVAIERNTRISPTARS